MPDPSHNARRPEGETAYEQVAHACPHAALVDIDRLVSVSEVAQHGPSWLLDQAEGDPVWLTRNSRVVAVIHPVRHSQTERG